MIINKKITDAVEVLRCFAKKDQFYWLQKLNLCNAEKGFIVIYLGLADVL